MLHLETSVLTLGSTERNQRESPLLRLPLELRDQIYEYVTIDDSYCGNDGVYDAGSKRKNAFAVRAICRQIYLETRTLPFTLGIFWLPKFPARYGWIEPFDLVSDHWAEQVPVSAKSIEIIGVDFTPCQTVWRYDRPSMPDVAASIHQMQLPELRCVQLRLNYCACCCRYNGRCIPLDRIDRKSIPRIFSRTTKIFRALLPGVYVRMLPGVHMDIERLQSVV